MDPVTHTLVGATLAASGLKRRTAGGTATLLIAANLPDIDILSLLWGSETGLWFRRGVTHGVLALGVLPLVLTAIIMLWDRLVRRRGGRVPDSAVRPGQVFLLSFIATASHPLLDFLNTYGMRWLMPFSDRWTYGDTLFIVDPWVWAVLVAGLFASRKREARPSASPPVVALTLVSAYMAAMALSNVAARSVVTRAAREQGIEPRRMMVAPLLMNPLARRVVIVDADVYRFGTFRWLRRPMFQLDDLAIDNYPSHPAASAAMRGPRPRKFLSWARFPFYSVEERAGTYIVRIGDARYTLDPAASWASTSIQIGRD